jgi:hypothetical protein
MNAGAEPGFSWRFLLTQHIIPREGIGVCNEGLCFIFFIAVPFERCEFYLSSHLPSPVHFSATNLSPATCV